jgi:hypothetical protein
LSYFDQGIKPVNPPRDKKHKMSKEASVSIAEVDPSIAELYPFNDPHYDPITTEGRHVRELFKSDITFSRASKIHHVCLSGGRVETSTIEGVDINIQDWHNKRQYESNIDAPIEVFLVPQYEAQSTLSVTLLTLISLIQTLSIPPTFIETLADNNGRYLASQSVVVDRDTSFGHEDKTFSLQVKIPLMPFANGSFYFRHDYATGKIIACIFFLPQFVDRLVVLLEASAHNEPSATDPFAILSALFASLCQSTEQHRQDVDQQVVQREMATGATLVSRYAKGAKAPIEHYPPLFDRLHSTQQHLMYLETSLRFNVKLVHFLQEQHEILTKHLLSQHRTGFSQRPKNTSKFLKQAKSVTESLNMSKSQTEHALEQVQILALRIRIQLQIVRFISSTFLPSTDVFQGRESIESVQQSHSSNHCRRNQTRQHGNENNRCSNYAFLAWNIHRCQSSQLLSSKHLTMLTTHSLSSACHSSQQIPNPTEDLVSTSVRTGGSTWLPHYL